MLQALAWLQVIAVIGTWFIFVRHAIEDELSKKFLSHQGFNSSGDHFYADRHFALTLDCFDDDVQAPNGCEDYSSWHRYDHLVIASAAWHLK